MVVRKRAAKSLREARDASKLNALMRVGAQQSNTSGGKYFNFPLALELVRSRLGVRFTVIELAEAEHEWKKKFGVLTADLRNHDVDRKDGYCFACGVFHSGDGFEVAEAVYPSPGESEQVADDIPTQPVKVREGSPYEDVKDVSHRELRMNLKLWTISQADIDPE